MGKTNDEGGLRLKNHYARYHSSLHEDGYIPLNYNYIMQSIQLRDQIRLMQIKIESLYFLIIEI